MTDLHGRHMPVPSHTLLNPVSLTEVISHKRQKSLVQIIRNSLQKLNYKYLSCKNFNNDVQTYSNYAPYRLSCMYKYIGLYIYIYRLFFFHWHYSQMWALACRTRSFHFFPICHQLSPSSLNLSSFFLCSTFVTISF
jgi:hypothetical protein